MKDRLAAFFRRIHGWLWYFGVELLLKRVLVPAMVVTVYLLPLGLTSIIVRVFRPSLLRNPDPLPNSFWRAAKGYEADRERCLRQS